MNIDDLGGNPEFPRKLLDKKVYVRVEPETGEPQLVRVEPNLSEKGEVLLDSVVVTIDEGVQVVMDREMVRMFLEDHGCVLLEELLDWKPRSAN